MIKIEKNVSLPQIKNKYPWDKMKVGDSFAVDKAAINNLHSNANYYLKKTKLKWKFTMRKNGDGVRVWRIK